MHLDGKNGQEIGSDGSNQRVKLGVGWGVGGVFGDSIGIRPWNAKSIGIVSYGLCYFLDEDF